jgi:hypothetical protein
MNRKLTAKVQQINPNLPAFSRSFSNAFVIHPDDENLKERKGTMYSVFDISGTEDFDVALVTKVVHDVLHDFYFQSDNVSPIQSLEKAIVEVRDRVTKLTNETIRNREASVDFNMLGGVLWGNVMYVVQYGQTGSFLMREGSVKPVKSNSEGHFSAASGVVKHDDVIIFCTQKFMERIEPDKLLHSSVSSEELPAEASGLILKFIVDTSFTQTEVVDFAGKEKAGKKFDWKFWEKGKDESHKPKEEKHHQEPDPTPPEEPKELNVPEQPTPTPPPTTPSGPDTSQPDQQPPEEKTTSQMQATKLADRPIIPTTSRLDIKIKPKRGFKLKPALPGVIVIVAGLLALSIFFTLRGDDVDIRDGEDAVNPPDSGILTIVDNSDTVVTRQQENTELDTTDKISRSDAEVFYDIKLTDPSADPAGIAVLRDYIAVTDKKSGKIYVSDRNTSKFTVLEGVFNGVSNPENRDGNLGFVSSQGYKVINPSTGEEVSSIGETDLGVTASYLGNIYAIKGDTLTKYESGGTSSVWAQSADLNGARSMAIAISIFVLKDNDLLSFTYGVKDAFTVTGLDKPFSSPTQVSTNLNFKNIYIADKGNRRVVVLNKDGAFVKQIKGVYTDSWQDIRGISVSSDERMLYLLDGSRVYEVEL